MKCENCGKNEATFFYRSNINGKVEQKNYCHECAKKLKHLSLSGIGSGSSDVTSSIIDGMRMSSGLMGPRFGMVDPMDMFFSTIGAGVFNYLMRNGLPDYDDVAEVGDTPVEGQKSETENIDTSNKFIKARNINKLKAELKAAVQAENFEHAAELRDKIKKLEQE